MIIYLVTFAFCRFGSWTMPYSRVSGFLYSTPLSLFFSLDNYSFLSVQDSPGADGCVCVREKAIDIQSYGRCPAFVIKILGRSSRIPIPDFSCPILSQE